MLASLHNPLVKHLVRLRENKNYRQEQGLVLICGSKLVKEISALIPARRLFVEKPGDAEGCQASETVLVSSAVLKKITGLVTPEPIAAEFPLPSPSSLQRQVPLLVLDAIRDPGNVGTLIRTALALGWKGVFFLPTCVDPFHEKVLRASRGACFFIPWRVGTWEELATLKAEGGLTLYTADMEGTPLDLVTPHANLLLLLSNEAQGVQGQTLMQEEKITIPMKGKMESLNVAVAGAILMYQLAR